MLEDKPSGEVVGRARDLESLIRIMVVFRIYSWLGESDPFISLEV